MMHAAVEASFPSADVVSGASGAPEGARVLWRVDKGEHHPLLYVVSPQQPDFTHIVEQAGWPTQPRWGVAEYGRLLDDLREGQLWQFRLAANPVKHAPGAKGQRGKRTALLTRNDQEVWLLRRAQRIGLSFDMSVEESGEKPEAVVHGPVSFRVEERVTLNFKRKGSPVTVSRARFDGVLRVADPDALRAALTHGVGPAKGYGCGLMTLAPVPGGASAAGSSSGEPPGE